MPGCTSDGSFSVQTQAACLALWRLLVPAATAAVADPQTCFPCESEGVRVCSFVLGIPTCVLNSGASWELPCSWLTSPSLLTGLLDQLTGIPRHAAGG
jgi:hypothetical protein